MVRETPLPQRIAQGVVRVLRPGSLAPLAEGFIRQLLQHGAAFISDNVRAAQVVTQEVPCLLARHVGCRGDLLDHRHHLATRRHKAPQLGAVVGFDLLLEQQVAAVARVEVVDRALRGRDLLDALSMFFKHLRWIKQSIFQETKLQQKFESPL